MRKVILPLLVSCVVAYAGGISIEDTKKDPILRGKFLAKHCAWCHDIEKNLLAPPFKVIMERYKNVPDEVLKEQLFNSIKNGSEGKWAKWMKENLRFKMGKPQRNLYMPAQKPFYTDEEIRLIIDWLLTLKKQKNSTSP
ncbi:MAG: cytochrome c [Aquificae bacterium]|nr:cytochrome c [Aquificota bacterium]